MHYTPTDSKALGRFMGDTNAQSAMTQRLAAGVLVGKLEAICSSGVLSEVEEADARVILVKAYKAFGFDSIAERPRVQIGDHDPEPANDSSFDAVQASVSQEMDRR